MCNVDARSPQLLLTAATTPPGERHLPPVSGAALLCQSGSGCLRVSRQVIFCCHPSLLQGTKTSLVLAHEHSLRAMRASSNFCGGDVSA